jgi:heme O synthase-like polyprenyltransferase
MGLTGIAPVLGAVSLWNNQTPLVNLVVLFCIGCLSHMYGFALNDAIDVQIDKLSKDLRARPLVRGTITRRKAAVFAVSCMIASFILSWLFFKDSLNFPILVTLLLLAYGLATLYDVESKKHPGMDVFVASAVFFLIIVGAFTVASPTTITWIVACIGGLKVLFMNMINGAIKDIDHDAKGRADTLAIRLGAGVKNGRVTLPLPFKTIGYLIEMSRSVLIFSPFIFLSREFPVQGWQIGLLAMLTVLIFFSIYKLFSIQEFKRDQVRRHIGIIVIFMYATTPVMLSSLHFSILLVALVPPLWFMVSNLVLHKTVLEPKTM